MESEVKPSTDSLRLLHNLTLESHLKFKALFCAFENTLTHTAINTDQGEKASAPCAYLHDSTGKSYYNGRHTCAYLVFGIIHKLYRE